MIVGLIAASEEQTGLTYQILLWLGSKSEYASLRLLLHS